MSDKINNLREVMDIGNPSFSVQDFSNYTDLSTIPEQKQSFIYLFKLDFTY